MPPSQLKRLKASLREAGVTGPQKSKKQKRKANDGTGTAERHEKLQQLRDSFNPFELRATSSRPSKNQHTVHGAAPRSLRYKDILHRPGVAKSVGEDMRRAKLLPEMQRKHKVGGVVDRRIGEGDARMTAEERAEQRFAAGFQTRGHKTKSLFDLEDSDGAEDMETAPDLLHRGRLLDDVLVDKIDAMCSDEESSELPSRKRRRSSISESEDDDQAGLDDGGEELNGPEYKKSKKEVMQEVIAKSKLHKYERQKVKEDDDDLREELDKDMPDLLSLLRNHKSPKQVSQSLVEASETRTNGSQPLINPERERLINGENRADIDREYDIRLKQLAQDAKAKPSERTKTAEEKAKEEAERLRDLEEKRQQRMRGEQVNDATEDADNDYETNGHQDEPVMDEAAEFGFATADPSTNNDRTTQLVLEDEDEFAFDEDLIASGSDVGISDASEPDVSSENGEVSFHDQANDDDEDEFVNGIFGEAPGPNGDVKTTGVAYTYPCPRTHGELLNIIHDISTDKLTTVIQRIRALHHPSLSATNKEAMADFSTVLVEHLSHMGLHCEPLQVVEQLIRHLHSLSRTYPERIAGAFRAQLKMAYERKDIRAGDMVILTAIGSIYPTSDHWHQVATPAMTLIARWLGMTAPATHEKARTGAFLVALSIHFQRLSKRIIPEALVFTSKTLRKGNQEEHKAHLRNLMVLADLWKDKSAFIELFQPTLGLLKQAGAKKEHQTLQSLLAQSRTGRRPLELHHHRPLPIRTSIPKFEEGFNPDKHYDPDKERSDSRKLKNEYKRERKGALRELRKDANFIAREQLREKRERDAEYEKKYRRLVAEVQGEAGRNANEYEREKAARKRKR